MTIGDDWNMIAIDVLAVLYTVDEQWRALMHAEMKGEGSLTGLQGEILVFVHYG